MTMQVGGLAGRPVGGTERMRPHGVRGGADGGHPPPAPTARRATRDGTTCGPANLPTCQPANRSLLQPAVPPLRWLLVAAALLLAGCADDELPAVAGAQGPVLLRQWQQPGQEPIALLARRVSHPRRDFRTLELSPVLVRMPWQDGIAFLAAPRATWSAGAAAGDLAGATVQGPVHLSGSMRGEPFLGRAADIRFDARSRRIELVGDASHPVELCVGGAIQRSRRLLLATERFESLGDTTIAPAPPLVAAALAALPERVVFPPLTAE